MDELKISFVATTRNDDHGASLLFRTQAFVSGLLEQCERHALRAELVMVEWNPPGDRPPLVEALHWPKRQGHCGVRLIQVPNSLHRRFKHHDGLPLFQMIAKNVGIRRSRAPFVAATNIDILFNDEVLRAMCGPLRSDRCYRIDRHDIPSDLPQGVPIEEQLRWCHSHVLRVNRGDGIIDMKTGVLNPFFNRSPKWWLADRLQDWGVIPAVFPTRLHTNACGDFTLLARQAWDRVGAYAEWELYSFHIDSLLVHAAHHAGIRQHILRDPARIYHIEHSVGSGWSPQGNQALRARLGRAGVPILSDGEFHNLACEMRATRQATVFNSKPWGLPDDELAETSPWAS